MGLGSLFMECNEKESPEVRIDRVLSYLVKGI